MRTRRQAGAVVLELALTLPFLLPILAVLLFYGRVLYNYEVAHKAAHDAVRYLSSANLINMKSPMLIAHETAVAQAIVQAEVSVLNPNVLWVSVLCDGILCSGLNTPTMVTVSVQIQLQNGMPGYAPTLSSQVILANHSMRYVGN
jgi:Flp pilus assembly protein TadG